MSQQQQQISECGYPPIPLTDSTTVTNSFVAASATAVKKAADIARQALETASSVTEAAPGTFSYKSSPLTSLELTALGVDALPSGVYFLNTDIAIASGLPCASFIIHYNQQEVGDRIIQVATEAFEAASTTQLRTWKRFYEAEDGVGWTEWKNESAGVPKGVITMWNGTVSSVPYGWALCNGDNGTPDLRDKFIRGAGGSSNPNTSGGSDASPTVMIGEHALTVAQIPSHTHGIATKIGEGDTSYTIGLEEIAGYTNSKTTYTGYTGSGQAHSHTASITDTTPPYYALCFIMKL